MKTGTQKSEIYKYNYYVNSVLKGPVQYKQTCKI